MAFSILIDGNLALDLLQVTALAGTIWTHKSHDCENRGAPLLG